jgi:FtsZ-interacting cell division protein ZipA
MSSLQTGLIIGGVVLVIGVLLYNWVQERRLRRRITATVAKAGGSDVHPGAAHGGARVEPTLAATRVHGKAGAGTPLPENPPAAAPHDAEGDLAMPESEEPASAPAADAPGAPTVPTFAPPPARGPGLAAADALAQPDADIECMITLQPVHPVAAGTLAAGLHARVGKPLRWFARATPGGTWQQLKADTQGEWTELAACMLLADRAGAATRAQVERFIRVVTEQAAALPAAFVAPDAAAEVVRAETLDRLCADLDVQIGLTVLKSGPAMIPGTRLRGVAEAAGFRLTDKGRFDWVHEDSGAVLYSLQNYKTEPFTADSLRLTSTPGAVFVLDVPRVADPARAFDQMKLAAKRMTQTLDGALVDDNRRPLDDAALAAIRQQVQATADALKAIRIDPGSPRALALFGG